MANVLDSLAVRLEADLDPLRRGMREGAAVVRQGADNIQSALGKLDATLGKIGLGFAGLVSVQALQGLYQAGRAAVSAAGDLGELAEQAGISTDALQILIAAGVQAGAKVEDITTGMGRFSKALATAATEGGHVGDTFNKLGINTRNSAGGVRDTMDALVSTAEALSKIESPAERIKVAMELLGRGGAKLLPILSQGREGIERFAAEARKMGLVLSADTVKAADEAADKLALLDLKSQKLNERIAAGVMPALTALILKFKEVAASIVSPATAVEQLDERLERLQFRLRTMPPGAGREGLLREIQKLQGEKDSASEDEALARLPRPGPKTDPGKKGLGTRDPVANQLGNLEEQLRLAKIPPGLERDQEAAVQQLRRAAESRNRSVSGGEDARARSLVKQIAAANAATEAENRLKQEYEQESQVLAQFGQTMQENVGKRMQFIAAGDQEIRNNERLIAALQISTDEYDKQRAILEILDAMRRQGLSIGPEEERQAARLAETLGRQRKQMEDVAEAHRDVRDAARDVVRAGAYGLQGLITGTNDWRGALKGVLDELVQIAIRLTLLKPLERGFETLLNGGAPAGGGFNPLSALGSLFNFGGGGSAAGQAGIAAGNFVPGGFFADGGAPPVGRASVVGERGPELFVPKVPGTIVPAGRWGSGGGGGGGGMTVIYNIDAAGADPSVVDRIKTVLGDHLRSHPQIVRGTVIAESGRGGAMARAMTRKG